MAYFIRVTQPTIGKYYITYSNMTVEVLGEYLDTYIFEYGETALIDCIYELRSGNVESNGIPYSTIEEILLPEPWYKQLVAGFAMAKKVVGIDPKLLRLREMLKKI